MPEGEKTFRPRDSQIEFLTQLFTSNESYRVPISRIQTRLPQNEFAELYDEGFISHKNFPAEYEFFLSQKGVDFVKSILTVSLVETVIKWRKAYQNYLHAGEERNIEAFQKYDNEAQTALSELREVPFELLTRLVNNEDK